MMFSPAILERFLERVSPEPNCGCWLWTGDYHDKGYGQLEKSVRPRRAHRFAYEAFVGSIPEGFVLDHKCRVRCCVNPEHLEAVTPQENTRRGAAARNGSLTHCARGHELVPENLRVDELRRGRRSCKRCHTTHSNNSRRRRKAAAQ